MDTDSTSTKPSQTSGHFANNVSLNITPGYPQKKSFFAKLGGINQYCEQKIARQALSPPTGTWCARWLHNTHQLLHLENALQSAVDARGSKQCHIISRMHIRYTAAAIWL